MKTLRRVIPLLLFVVVGTLMTVSEARGRSLVSQD